MTLRPLPTLFLLSATPFVAACNDDGHPCDPNQILQDRICVAAPVEAGPTDAGEGVDIDESDGVIVDAPVDIVFGRICTMSGDSAECAAPAPYCAVQPGAMMGYCTTLGCKDDMSICPTGWTCFQIASINLDFCLKPP